MFDEYLVSAETCLARWCEAFTVLLERGPSVEFDTLVAATHAAESACDDHRRRMEASFYEKALIPETRGDMVFLIEALDLVPSKADAIVHEVQAEFLRIPASLTERFSLLVKRNGDCFRDLAQAVRLLFTDMAEVPPLVQRIDRMESETDQMERDLIRAIFSDPTIAPDQRILLKSLVIDINKVSDFSEHASDKLTILTVKRMI